MRLSISLKILSGYLILAVFLVGASWHALLYLHRVSETSQLILNQSVQATTAIRGLQTAMSSLEQCAEIYPESPSPGVLNLFQYYRRQFDQGLLRASVHLPGSTRLDELRSGYALYLDQFEQQIELVAGGRAGEAKKRAATVLGPQAGHLHGLLDTLHLAAQRTLDAELISLRGFSSGVSTAVFFTSLFGVLCGLVAVILTALQLNGGIRKLKEATFMVGKGNFDLNLGLRTGDALEDLAKSFEAMAQKLKMSEQLCLDASPLTYLPGNIAIERALTDRIKRDVRFALCYIDLDDFKAFNDHYGYARGSEVIKAVADLLAAVRGEVGGENDFIGHIGGDDFVFITEDERAEAICRHVIQRFDAMIPEFYSEEDRRQGFITGIDRYGQTRQFPLMTISIAVVSDARRDIHSPAEIARVAAEIKDFVKTRPGSNYHLDRRERAR
ncbi:GGDEF domain-containing protein [Geoalkalibacter sp.]|uniref:GGDEF domain-containing protein n=1 Tax=Geoalkalibacter sp. TaxID=3041440 RepID=UPI00272E2007|nr:GGDEF domain-containing protein [Geoalkalibacter sp.]